ncbi:MAG: hypothetical protein QME96_16330, partial [Myxococcota bacterium]|nr:hypothetical protein [Myxococcota bacterium]
MMRMRSGAFVAAAWCGLSCATGSGGDGQDVPLPPGDVEAGDAEAETCPAGSIRCGAECVDPMSDERNCSGCNIACSTGETCSDGTCRSECSAPLAGCGDACVDLQTSAEHCGACEAPCEGLPNADSLCSDGACAISACHMGFVDANGAAWDGCEYACTATGSSEGATDGTCDDGRDNDCDGRTDDGDPDCADCVPEFCDGLDNDCDG